MPLSNLPYNPEELKRELTKHYISATDAEISEMLKDINTDNLENLYSHISGNVKFNEFNKLGPELEYAELVNHMETMASKNNIKTCFIGDGLKNYSESPVVPHICSIRGLTTAYTPYQPERSQGTLRTLWYYSSGLSALTGMEAINASFYERSTCLYEAIQTGIRISKNKKTIIVCDGIYPGDKEVLETLRFETDTDIRYVSLDKETGKINPSEVLKLAQSLQESLGGLVFSQVNSLGILEDVHALTDIATDLSIPSIALIDPILNTNEGLVPPSEFGKEKQGATMIVGEAQHLAIKPNFGGPGLGLFGIRYNDSQKAHIRSTAGRYVGKAIDAKGEDCLCMVLSTREQHIRREKATSNICSNQSYLATITGASLLERGTDGLTEMIKRSREMATKAMSVLTQYKEVELAFNTTFFNEFTLEINTDIDSLISEASESDLHLGVNVSDRIDTDKNLLLLSFFDHHKEEDLQKLINFFDSKFTRVSKQASIPGINTQFVRTSKAYIPKIDIDKLKDHYDQLGGQNVSPDDAIYPLGSCTMKYNPYVNDYAAGLSGFTDIHPQAPEKDAQGCLEILFETQEMFKAITGLPAVTTQPVAGAQGELVGIKMFQAYHKDNSKDIERNIILIPRSAHGTNPATATMAGYQTKTIDGKKVGIVTIEANNEGQIDFNQLQEVVKEYSTRISGIMVTNPNTSGVFENQFKEMSELIHSVGGLVYMDGANMNAIAGIIDLKKLGVDAVHNNLHKTWTIPHGGGGPGDAIVAVSDKLENYLPGVQVRKNDQGLFETFRPSKSIGSFHRHHGNFAHKVRCYTYIKALGDEGVKRMSQVAVLSAKYLYHKLKEDFPILPSNTDNVARMHEFIITLNEDTFKKIQDAGTPKAQAIAKVGKLFLDFGMHAPTVAFPEIYGLMIEPTESFTKKELDRFIDIVRAIKKIINTNPEVLTTVPHFTPVNKVDEVYANKNLCLSEPLPDLYPILPNKADPKELQNMNIGDICQKIVDAHNKAK